jgi:hypothetical protein
VVRICEATIHAPTDSKKALRNFLSPAELPLLTAHAIRRAVNRGADQNIGISSKTQKKKKAQNRKVHSKQLLRGCEVSSALI